LLSNQFARAGTNPSARRLSRLCPKLIEHRSVPATALFSSSKTTPT
jgi:hypothetical protein